MPGMLGPQTEEERKRVERVQKLLTLAETDRNRHRARISTCYKFGLPWRHGFDQSQPTDQLDDVFISIVMAVLEDFGADMGNTFTPRKSAWVSINPVKALNTADSAMIAGQLQEYTEVLFAEMARSNLYSALQEGYLDLGPGTMGLCIKDLNPAEPIHCEAIPAPELLLVKGPYGMIQAIFRKWPKMRGAEIGVLWNEAKGPKEKAFEPDDAAEYDVIDGVMRDWSKPAHEAWEYSVLVNERLCYGEKYEGKGSNPLIVARWSRDSTTAWGVGPTYRVTPAIKTLNYLAEKKLKAIDLNLAPIVSFEDDGVINVDHGVAPALWIPRAAGSKAPETIESKAKLEPAFLEEENLIHEIKRAHYQDRPEQTGKTPPSATQWADEAAERARRMGTPATNLVHELQYAIVHRFAYLLGRRGKLPKVELNGDMIALEPVSPLLRAQEQEEVVRIGRWLEMLGAYYGPQTVIIATDVFETAKVLGKKMGIPEGILRDPNQLAQAMQQFAPILGQVAGATGDVAPQAPAGVP